MHIRKEDPVPTTTNVEQQVIINHATGEECRIAIMEDGRLEEFYAEREAANLHVGNIYLGRVVNLEPSIQAAFIDFGVGRNGFLHITDLHPMLFPGKSYEDKETVGKKTPHRQRPPIQDCLKRDQVIVVQVLKEGIGTKGPTLTSYLSIPGRYLVMMPNMEKHGVSRRLEDLDERREAKKILDSIKLPDDFGFILRTAGLDRTKTELKRDLAYLTRLWKNIKTKQNRAKAPAELYSESDLLVRTIRDVISPAAKKIWIDDQDALNRIQEFMRIVAPRSKTSKLHLYQSEVPIFHHFKIEDQIRIMHSHQVPLPCGGSLVIDQAEAMVAIDVNSGRTRKFRDAENTAYHVNLEAVDEIARQLRLRDLGGLIVLDLIDMRDLKHRKTVENKLRELLKRDRAKTETLRISRFGLIEMTRQRMRPSLQRAYFEDCPACAGRGQVKTTESTIIEALRDLAVILSRSLVQSAEMVLSSITAGAILSQKRQELVDLEHNSGKSVIVRVSASIPIDRIDFYAYDLRGNDLNMEKIIASEDEIKASIDSPDNKQIDNTKPTMKPNPSRPGRRKTKLDPPQIQDEQNSADSDQESNKDTADSKPGKQPTRRRRRSRRKSQSPDTPDAPDSGAAIAEPQHEVDKKEPTRKKKTTTRTRRRKSYTKDDNTDQDKPEANEDNKSDSKQTKKKRSRRRKSNRDRDTEKSESIDNSSDIKKQDTAEETAAPKKKTRRKRKPSTASSENNETTTTGDQQTTTLKKNTRRKTTRKKKITKKSSDQKQDDQSINPKTKRKSNTSKDKDTNQPIVEPKSKPRRGLYGSSRRKIHPGHERPDVRD